METSTGDPEGEVTARAPVDASAQEIDAVLLRFLGPQDQVPPMHSAVHVNGRRLYEYARAGEEVERASRPIVIHEISRRFLRGDELGIAVSCSKGTYVRSLAMDIGRALGCGACLVGLRRTAAGSFRVEDAMTLEAVEADPLAARSRLLPPEALVAQLARQEVAGDAARRFAHGQAITAPPVLHAGETAVFGPGGRFLGVGHAQCDGRIVPVRLMARGIEAESPDFA
jgi:tRNA pseudouridine55 synthase